MRFTGSSTALKVVGKHFEILSLREGERYIVPRGSILEIYDEFGSSRTGIRLYPGQVVKLLKAGTCENFAIWWVPKKHHKIRREEDEGHDRMSAAPTKFLF